jgi:predicted Zn-dependent peptidase
VPGNPELGPQIPTPKPPAAKEGAGTESVNADEAWRNEPPKAAAPRPLHLPVPESATLPNGLTVILSQRTGLPVVAADLVVKTGGSANPPDKPGLAAFTAAMLDEGTTSRTAPQIADDVAQLGASLSATSSMDASFVQAASLTKNFQQTLDLMADVALHPVFPAEEVDRQRASRLGQLTQIKEDPSQLVSVVMSAALYGDHHPYGYPNIGTEASLNTISRDDMAAFWKQTFVPNNAALVVAGDIDPAQTLAWIKSYFGPIPSASVPPQPDISEPRQEQEKRVNHDDPLATRPAIAVGYHAPPRGTPEWYAMGLIDQLLVQGHDSRLYQSIVQKQGLAGSVDGGINVDLGNMFDVAGPILWTVSLIHDADKPADRILGAIDAEVAKLQSTPVTRDELALANTKLRSSLYAEEESLVGFGRANLLASFALFDDDPAKINQIEDAFARVTPELIQKTAREYLRATNRTVLTITPKAKAGEQGGAR